MNYQTSRKGQGGQALILVALAAIGLFAFAALAIDGSRSFSNKRHAQNAADTGALTAALAYIRTPGNDATKFTAAQAAAEARVIDNEFTHNGDTVVVDVDRCDDTEDRDPSGNLYWWDIDPATTASLACTGLPTADEEEYLRVRIISTIPTTFGRVLGRQTLTAAAEAIARVQGDSSSSLGTSFNGAAMYATSDDPSTGNSCFTVAGGAKVHTYGSGVYVNCPKDVALNFQSGGGENSTQFIMDKESSIPGCAKYSGQAENPGIKCHQGSALKIDANTFAYVPTKPPTPVCNSSSMPPGQKVGDTYKPGFYSGDIVVTSTSKIDPGLYCVSGRVYSSAASLTQSSTPSGTVKFVMLSDNKDFGNGSSATFDFSDLEVFTSGSNFDINGTLEADRLRYYSSGDGNFSAGSGASVESGNAYFYLHRGDWQLTSGSGSDLRAPTTNDPYANLLVHLPWENENQITINGQSDSYFQGTFLAPHSKITINGGADYELHSQLIGYEFNLTGGNQVDIYYLASQNIPPPSASNPTIEFTK